jgi:hypothetical protein
MTDKYPFGKLNKNDEGALDMAIGVEGNTVRIDFGKPVAWFAMPPGFALELAGLLTKHAETIKRNFQ